MYLYGKGGKQMEHIMENYYLNEKCNKIIVVVMLMNAIMCILVGDNKINIILGVVCTLCTCAGISLSSLKSTSGYKKESVVKDVKPVDRRKRFNLFQDKKGIIILTGDSGVGKSCLLSQFEKMHESECKLIDNNYFYDWNYDDFKGKRYIILDQFEKALFVSNFEDKILFLKQLRNEDDVLIIISIRKEYLGDIYRAFSFDKEINIEWLNYDNAEIKEIKEYLQNVVGHSNAENEKFELYNAIIKDLSQNRITFIQLSYVCKSILGNERAINSVNKQWIKVKDYNVLVSSFLEMQIDDFVYKDLAYNILYLMCQDKKGLYINRIADFQNVSMQSSENIKNTIQFLNNQKLIKKVKTSENIRPMETEEYEISHDYLLDLLENLCINKIDANIRNNIEFYNKNYQTKRDEYKAEKEFCKEKINDKYYNFFQPKSKIYVNVLLYVMIIGVSLLNSYILMENMESSSCLILAGVNIMVGESIYYIYNYYYQFMRIFGLSYIISILFGMVCCWSAYIFTDYWALCLGAEILLMGTLMLFVNRKVRKSERKFFLTRFQTFTAIGIITIVLGVCFPLYVNGKIMLALPLFILYGGYMILGIIGHINKTYILALMGKTLLIGKELETK